MPALANQCAALLTLFAGGTYPAWRTAMYLTETEQATLASIAMAGGIVPGSDFRDSPTDRYAVDRLEQLGLVEVSVKLTEAGKVLAGERAKT